MRVGILGPLEVELDGRTVEIGGARLRTMLIRLSLDVGRVVTVDALSTALWPEGGPADQAHALQSLVSRLRRALHGHPSLRSAAGGYCLDLPPEAVDALRFERLAQQGRRLLRDGDAQAAARHLREALGLWRGEALAGLVTAPFAAATVVRLEEVRLAAVEDRVEAELATSTGHVHAVAELDQLVAAFPLRERLRVLLIRTLHANGRQAEALAVYEGYRKLLAEELGTDPGQELRDAHLAVLRGNPAPSRRSATRPLGNVRVALSSFVGRSEELARVSAQLQRGRLVTLIGTGGVGKTRLASTVVIEMIGAMPGGVWLVELASVTDPGDLPQAVMGALGLRDGGLLDDPAAATDPIGRLVEAFTAADALVVLDNCEHLLGAVARFVDELLGRCPGLRVLTTSREPLDVPGEVLCPVLPLEQPEPGTPLAQAVTYPAVRLFTDRVTAVRPDFLVDDDNVALVVEICHRLDGLPLAIELAAARLRSMPIEQLVARLGDRFRLLSGGSRTALPRHQTLRAVVAWSWDLLDETERWLAARLAVFPRDITLESAEGVCARGGLAAEALLDHMSALVDKSLLHVVDGPEARYRMLQTIREYGLEQLAGSGDLARAREQHAGYFLDLAESAGPHLRGPDQLTWVARLTAEHDNLPATLHYAVATGDAGTAIRLTAALSWFWTIQGNHADAANWMFLALQVPGESPTAARAVATAFYLFNRVLAGGSARTNLAYEDSLLLAHEVEGPAAHPTAALIEASLALTVDDVASGLAAIDRSVPYCDPWGRGTLLLMRAFLQGNHGDMSGTHQTLIDSVAAFRKAGERWGLALSLTALADADAILGDFDGVIDELSEAIRLLRELDPDDDAIQQRAALATARTQKGDIDQARAELEDMVAPGTVTSSARYLLFARVALGNLDRYGGDLAAAARQYGAASDELTRLPFSAPLYQAVLGSALGHLGVAEGDVAGAVEHLGEALALASGVPDMPVVALVGAAVARVRLAQGDPRAATEILGASHTLRGAPDAFNPDVAGLVQELVARLGRQSYDTAYARGRGRDRGDALDFIESELARGR